MPSGLTYCGFYLEVKKSADIKGLLRAPQRKIIKALVILF